MDGLFTTEEVQELRRLSPLLRVYIYDKFNVVSYTNI